MESNDWIIPLYKIYTDDEDINLITNIVKRGRNWAIGPEIEQLEKAIRDYVGVDYCLALNSGTSALHSCLLAYGFGINDEIIVPSFSFIATANCVQFVNATAVFADIEETNLGLDPNAIKQKITSNTKAILPVDFAGMSCKIYEINKLAKENNIKVIEDAAESLGSSVNNKKVGSLSDIAIFSFCGNKVLTTGEGGAIVTNSKQLYEKIKQIRSHGRLDNNNYFNDPREQKYLDVGYNWRMSSITAALGISQMAKLDKLIKMRQENAKFLSSKLSKIPDIKIPTVPSGYEHIYQMYCILLRDQNIRDQLHEYLIKKKIFSKVYFQPIHKMDFYRNKYKDKISLPITEKISETILTLPLYPNMTNEEKNYLTESVFEFFELKSKV